MFEFKKKDTRCPDVMKYISETDQETRCIKSMII